MGLTNSYAVRHPLRGIVVNLLLMVALALLFYGLQAPILTLEKFYVFSNTVSLLSALQTLAGEAEWGLFLLVGAFSVAFPVLKICAVGTDLEFRCVAGGRSPAAPRVAGTLQQVVDAGRVRGCLAGRFGQTGRPGRGAGGGRDLCFRGQRGPDDAAVCLDRWACRRSAAPASALKTLTEAECDARDPGPRPCEDRVISTPSSRLVA